MYIVRIKCGFNFCYNALSLDQEYAKPTLLVHTEYLHAQNVRASNSSPITHQSQWLPHRHHDRDDHSQNKSSQAALGTLHRTALGADIHRTQCEVGLVRRRLRAIDFSIPAESLEAACADVWYARVGALHAPLQDSTSHASRPGVVDTAIAHCDHLIAIQNYVIALAYIVRSRERRVIALINIGEVREIDDKRCHGSGV